MKRLQKEQGLLSLEACICVTIFIFLMLFIYSFFIFFEARNVMAHVTLATADSMALDAYESSNKASQDTLIGLLQSLYNTNIAPDSGFRDVRDWYADATEDDPDAQAELFEDAVRARFLAYLGNGDDAQCERMLKRLHIREGIDELDFSKTRVEGGKLYIVVSYTLDYEFNVFSLNGVQMEHTACSKVWGK